jgi:poly(3-hydroxybutyrate) depolymerase
VKRILLVGTGGALIIAALAAWWGRAIDAEIVPRERVIVGEVPREYRLVVPRNLPQPMPVVFAFHGMGDSTESMAAYSQLDRLAAEKGFLLVYPAARKSMWLVDGGDAKPDLGNPDLRLFDELLTALSARFNIDRNRIYLM